MKSTPKVRPMIFNADMVRALLEGRKTQTRRIAKINESGRFKFGKKQWHPDDPSAYLASPWQVGDLIYVRETFRIMDDGDDCGCEYPCAHKTIGHPAYLADDIDCERKWTPSSRMPRWASRLTLKVTTVRVERVQDISLDDCIAEGFAGGHGSIPGYIYNATPTEHFGAAWKQIYGESWNRNDWVWVIDFEVIRQNVDSYLAEASA